MPRIENSILLPFPVGSVFDVLAQPANWPILVPVEMALRIITGPDKVVTDSVVELEGKYWGFKRKITFTIKECERPRSFLQVQKEGPFRHWIHSHLFDEVKPEETRLTEVLEFEGPGGMLGLVLTPAMVERQFRQMVDARAAGLARLIGK